MDRFDFHLKDLKSQLTIIERYKDSHERAEIKLLDDAIKAVRGPAFMLETLIEIYEDIAPNELEGLKDLVKVLEDEAGGNVDRNDHLNTLKKYAQTQGAKTGNLNYLSKTIAYMAARNDEARKNMLTLLKNSKWLNSPLLNEEIEKDKLKHPGELAFDRITRKLKKIEWPSKRKDRDFITGHTIKFIKDDLLDVSKYDLADLNGPMGLHKRRRMDRKLAMLMAATNGLFVLTDEGTPKAYQELLTDPIAKSKYASLPQGPAEGKTHIFVPRGLFLEMNRNIEQLGFAKDFGEAMHEWIPEMLLGSGETQSIIEAKKMAEEIVSSWDGFKSPLAIAEPALKRLTEVRKNTAKNESTVYTALITSLKRQIGMSKKADCQSLAASLK